MEEGISDAETASATTISTVVRRGFNSLNDSITHAGTFEGGTSKITLEDERGRLNVWASNLGALQPANSSSSLDHRLKDDPLIRQSVHSGLERLLILVARASRILNGSAPNRTGSTVLENCDSGSKSRSTTELEELLLGIRSAINHLFRLSMLIRRQRPRGRLPVLDSFAPLENSPDIRNVTDMFPKTKLTPWLAQRLGNEVTRRREIIRYRQNHRKGFASPVDDKIEDRSNAVTFATSFQETGHAEAAANNLGTVTSRPSSVFTSSTSYLSAEDSINTGRRVPHLSDMRLDGVQLQYGEKFECPYCRTTQKMKNQFEWKKHVMSDLQPYVCTFKDCPPSTYLFPNRAEWFRHELSVHRLEWACNLCKRPPLKFNSADGLKKHFGRTHPGEVTDSQMPLILESCERPMASFGPFSCPLCTDWQALPAVITAEDFGRHLARHLQHLALGSLSLTIEGLEIESPKGTTENENENKSVSSKDGNEETASIKPVETTQAKETLETELQSPKIRQADAVLAEDDLDIEKTEKRAGTMERVQQEAQEEHEAEGANDARISQTPEDLQPMMPETILAFRYEHTSQKDSTEETIDFEDIRGRKFTFPFYACRNWKDMQDLIKQSFENVGSVVGRDIQQGRYSLLGPDGIILPQNWENTIKVGMSIKMTLEPGLFRRRYFEREFLGVSRRGRSGESSDRSVAMGPSRVVERLSGDAERPTERENTPASPKIGVERQAGEAGKGSRFRRWVKRLL